MLYVFAEQGICLKLYLNEESTFHFRPMILAHTYVIIVCLAFYIFGYNSFCSPIQIP